MLVAFFDESGHWTDTPVVAVACATVPEEAKGEFDRKWQTALRKAGAPYLHMREFAHFQGPYKGWTEKQRRHLLFDLVGAINEFELSAYACAMESAVFTELTSHEQARLINPFFCCLQEVAPGPCIEACVDEPPSMMRAEFAESAEFESKLVVLWYLLRQAGDLYGSVEGIGFSPMSESPGLQAADLMAYEVRLAAERALALHPGAQRWPFEQLFGNSPEGVLRLVKEPIGRELVRAHLDGDMKRFRPEGGSVEDLRKRLKDPGP